MLSPTSILDFLHLLSKLLDFVVLLGISRFLLFRISSLLDLVMQRHGSCECSDDRADERRDNEPLFEAAKPSASGGRGWESLLEHALKSLLSVDCSTHFFSSIMSAGGKQPNQPIILRLAAAVRRFIGQ